MATTQIKTATMTSTRHEYRQDTNAGDRREAVTYVDRVVA